MPDSATAHPSSFRDPSGYIFEKDGVLYRQVNQSFKDHFDLLITSGCYQHLVAQGLLVPHETITGNLTGDASAYLTLQPARINFISYPYEWSFSRLRDAALLTLKLLREALAFGMILKDATPYNVQWHKGKLIFIDTLSFEKYEETPWIAYRQFCETFLAPLLLMHYSKHELSSLQLAWPDGIPLGIVKSLLPKRSRFSVHTYLHIHLHARLTANKKPGDTKKIPHFPKQKLLQLASSLESLIQSLKAPELNSTWSGYYEEVATRQGYMAEKKRVITEWIDALKEVKTVADLGANEGEFSRLFAERGLPVVATDQDPYCIDRLYRQVRQKEESNIQPLVVDLANPSPATGLNNQERASFLQRCNADLVLALALIHHLCIGRNIPLEKAAQLLADCGQSLIIEFVPKDDPKVQEMLQTKKDIYTDYNEAAFVRAFETRFTIIKKQAFTSTKRILFFLQRK